MREVLFPWLDGQEGKGRGNLTILWLEFAGAVAENSGWLTEGYWLEFAGTVAENSGCLTGALPGKLE